MLEHRARHRSRLWESGNSSWQSSSNTRGFFRGGRCQHGGRIIRLVWRLARMDRRPGPGPVRYDNIAHTDDARQTREILLERRAPR